MDNKCPVCGSDIPKPKQHKYKNDYITEYVCTRCGNFNVFGGYSHFLPALLGMDANKIAVISHWIRTQHESITNESPDKQFSTKPIIIDNKLVDTILKRLPPNPTEQANNIIRWLGKNMKAPGEFIKLQLETDLSIMGAITPTNFALVIKHLIETGIMKGALTTNTANVTLSFEGWKFYEGLKQGIIQAEQAIDSQRRVVSDPKKSQKLISHTTPTDSRRNRELLKGKPMNTTGTLWKLPSSQDIWCDIYEDFEVKKLTFAKSINFVTDDYKRKAIFRDIEQSYILAKNGFSKPAVILAGSVIEELLRLYLKTKKLKPANNTFDEYIKACEKGGFLKGAVNHLSDSVRHFRNLVHLEKETSPKHKISKATAKSAVASIFIISNDFQKN